MFYDCPSRYGKKSMRKENSGLFFCQQKTNSRQKNGQGRIRERARKNNKASSRKEREREETTIK